MQLTASAARAPWWLIFSLSSRISGSFPGTPLPREPSFSISSCMELLCARCGIPLTPVGLPRNSHQLVSDCFPQLGIILKLGKNRRFVFLLGDAASCAVCAVFSAPQNHVWFGLESTLNNHLVQLPCCGQGHLLVDQVAQRSILALNTSSGRASTIYLRTLFQCLATCIVKNMLPLSNPNQPPLSLMSLPFVLKLKALVKSFFLS